MKRKKESPKAKAKENGAKKPPMAKWQRDRLVRLNQVIARAARYKKMKQARKAFEQILEEKLQPSAQTFGSLVNAAVRVGDLSEARRWLQESQRRGVNPGVVAYTTLLKGLCEAGQIDESREALKEMVQTGCKPNIRTANTLLRGYRRAGEVEASIDLLRQMEEEWDVAPDATSSEYLVALLCQGFQVKAARSLLKRITTGESASNDGEIGEAEAFGTWEGGISAALRSRASLWTMLAESFLLSGEVKNAQKSLRRARLLRRKASKHKEPNSEAFEGNSSTALFTSFKERELSRRATLIAEKIRSGGEPISKAQLLKQMGRLLALPRVPTNEIGADALLAELKRSFGLAELSLRLRWMENTHT